jgi:hypothetical protein
MADEKDKPKLGVLPTSQVDLQDRLDNDFRTDRVNNVGLPEEVEGLTVEGNDTSGYTSNVDPMYRNYANETEKPIVAEEGAEAEAELVLEDAASTASTVPVEEEKHDVDEDESAPDTSTSSAGPGVWTAPAASSPTTPSDQ